MGVIPPPPPILVFFLYYLTHKQNFFSFFSVWKQLKKEEPLKRL